MKTSVLKIVAVVAFSYMLDSCQELNSGDVIQDAEFCAIRREKIVTKTALQEDGTMFWMQGDDIKVFSSGTSGRFVPQITNVSEIATFKGSFDSRISSDDFAENGVVAFFPYSDDVMLSDDGLSFTLPSVQTGVSGCMEDAYYPAVAQSNNSELSFYNICGGVKFVVYHDNVKTVTLKGNNSEILAGKVNVLFNNDGLPEVEIVEGKTEIVVSAPDDSVFDVGKPYYIVTVPVNLENGFTMVYNDNEDSMYNTYRSDEAISIERSVFTTFTELDKELPIVNADAPIVFADNIIKLQCVNAFDTNGDGELSYREAAAVTDLTQLELTDLSFTSFDELEYFTGITSIPDAKFLFCINLTSIKFPSNIVSIGNVVFNGCLALTSIEIPESVVTIGDGAFAYCFLLDSIELPSGIRNLGADVFVGCSSLKHVGLNEGLTNLGERVFSGCSMLTNIKLPSTLTSIGNSAFYDCCKLMEIRIPDYVTSIGDYAFKGCSELANVAGGKNVEIIGRSLFEDCVKLTSISLSDGLEEIPEYSFRNCQSLPYMEIPSGVKVIRWGAFENCINLASVVLSDGLESLEASVFGECYSLTSVSLPETLTQIGGGTFRNCSSLTSIKIPSGVTEIQRSTFANCSSLVSVELPESLTKIRYSFYGCSSLETIIVPERVTHIACGAFDNCIILKSAYVKSIIPPTIYNDSAWDDDIDVGGVVYTPFSNTSPDMLICVPQESLNLYRSTWPWSGHEANIVGIDFESLDKTEI